MSQPELMVWLQGGPADGHRYITFIEPERTLCFIPDPTHAGEWVRVAGATDNWPDQVAYGRVPDVEQFDHERIYYPLLP